MLGDLACRLDLIRLGALPDRADEPPRIVADVSRLIAEVGFRPRFDLRGGLQDALAFWAALPSR
jgi:nucleoside-diphosphate-sugar epimerase